jgi:hypothetical protein
MFDQSRTVTVLLSVGNAETVALQLVSPCAKNCCGFAVVPTSSQYSETPIPLVHWNVTVDDVNVDEGAGANI